MAFEVVWTEPALADLEAIVNQLAGSSAEAAQRVSEGIINHVEVLRTFPRIGPRYPKDERGLVREIVSGRYRIFYNIDDEQQQVEILTIWHGSRRDPDLSRIFP